MDKEVKVQKSKIAEREEEILKFWKENKIFEKSLNKESPEGEFVFYDGPPFATGLPHYGSLLSSVIKDVVPRYKTMRGFRVRRRWGWDTHGLPIESLVEKKLKLETKKDIEKIGIAAFNKEARSMVLQYANDWEKYVERIGRWVEFKNSYKTMDNSYIESVWWALSRLNEKGLLYEGRKVLMYCTHCETPLAKAEIAMDNSYRDITEEAVTLKFRIENPKKYDLPENTFLLAWTTTPWTLPGNVALAVGNDIDYAVVEKNKEFFILADSLVEKALGSNLTVFKKMKGEKLVNIEYRALFDVPEIRRNDTKEAAYKVYSADFVNIEDGTGIVHTAVMYGEDDHRLGLQLGLPMVDLLDVSGKYNDYAPEFLRGKYIKEAEDEIKKYLKDNGTLLEGKNYTHSYPHCYRCGTPLIYNALPSWFINIQKIKEKLLELNKKINWFPEHLKYGRFQNIVENAPDWNISRNRYWASPLPIWKNEKLGKIKVIGSIDELKKHIAKSGNKYFVMRHGEAELNLEDLINSDPKNIYHLTGEGKSQAKIAAQDIKSKKIDIILTSPFTRCRETAEIVRQAIGLEESDVVVEDKLWEFKKGTDLEGKKWQAYYELFGNTEEKFKKEAKGGENLSELKKRMGDFIYELDKKYSNKNILLIGHRGPMECLFMATEGADLKSSVEMKDSKKYELNYAEFRELDFVPLPHNEDYELDLHKPFIDHVCLVDGDGTALKRVPEVVDCWVESGSMPFAEWHYPVENKKEFGLRFPGDFIAEYIAQTRTWFYYMHVLSTALFENISFKNVVTTGTILAADGDKMSKSLGNYTDPLINIDKFSSDTLRFYLMGSVVMQAEDINFKDEELREVHNRVINMIWNSCRFYEMYTDNNTQTDLSPKNDNILDKWIISRLNETISEATNLLEQYNMPPVCRLIKDFAEDFSTWFLRRSRERFKSGDPDEYKAVRATTGHVFINFAKIIAPLTPFLAEHIYQKVKKADGQESVHLCEWPKAGKIDTKVLSNMGETRKIVSLALEKRMAAGIKVRQPLNKVQILKSKFQDLGNEYTDLIKDEVNVKSVEFSDDLKEEVELDTIITPELQKEGNMRELVRAIQDLRKRKNLVPSDAVNLLVETDEKGKEFLNSVIADVRKPTNVSEIKFKENGGDEVEVEEMKFKMLIE